METEKPESEPAVLKLGTPRWNEADVAADGAVGQRDRAAEIVRTAAVAAGGVAADGAVGQRGRAAVVVQAAAVVLAELPLTVQSVSVVVPPLLNRPPPLPSPALPPVIVSPEIDAVTPRVDLEHPARVVAADRHARRRARDRLVPVVSLSSSWVPFRVIVCGVLNTPAVEVDRVGPPGRIRLADRHSAGCRRCRRRACW